MQLCAAKRSAATQSGREAFACRDEDAKYVGEGRGRRVVGREPGSRVVSARRGRSGDGTGEGWRSMPYQAQRAPLGRGCLKGSQLTVDAITLLATDSPTTAEAEAPSRVYRSSLQLVAGLGLSVVMVGLAAGCVLQPTARSHGGYVIAAVAIVAAAGMVRFALSGVRVSADGVRVMNMFKTTHLEWQQIREFKLSSVGACVIGLEDGRWVAVIGIEQTNWAALTRRHDTPERRMIEELNELLHQHRDGDSSLVSRSQGTVIGTETTP